MKKAQSSKLKGERGKGKSGGQRTDDGGQVGDGEKIREELKRIVPEYKPKG